MINNYKIKLLKNNSSILVWSDMHVCKLHKIHLLKMHQHQQMKKNMHKLKKWKKNRNKFMYLLCKII